MILRHLLSTSRILVLKNQKLRLYISKMEVKRFPSYGGLVETLAVLVILFSLYWSSLGLLFALGFFVLYLKEFYQKHKLRLELEEAQARVIYIDTNTKQGALEALPLEAVSKGSLSTPENAIFSQKKFDVSTLSIPLAEDLISSVHKMRANLVGGTEKGWHGEVSFQRKDSSWTFSLKMTQAYKKEPKLTWIPVAQNSTSKMKFDTKIEALTVARSLFENQILFSYGNDTHFENYGRVWHEFNYMGFEISVLWELDRRHGSENRSNFSLNSAGRIILYPPYERMPSFSVLSHRSPTIQGDVRESLGEHLKWLAEWPQIYRRHLMDHVKKTLHQDTGMPDDVLEELANSIITEKECYLLSP
jgi:hypothetical protein